MLGTFFKEDRVLRIFALSFMLMVGLLGTTFSPCMASNLTRAEKQVQQNLSVEGKAQKRLQAWEDKKASLEARIRDMVMEKTWLEYQNRKYQEYILKEKAELAALEAQQRKMELINMRLEPYLDEVTESLKKFIASDLPFLPKERAKRIAFLEESLGDYHLSLSEKLRRVLEALHVEADYGRTLEALDSSISLNGNTIQGRIFRLGRTGLFFQSIDKHVIAHFDPASASWKPLDTDYERGLEEALQIVDRKRAAQLLLLPLQGGNHE